MNNLKRDIRWLLRGPVHIAKGDNSGNGFTERTFYWCWPMRRFTRLARLRTYRNWDIMFDVRTGFEFTVGKWNLELVNKEER